MPDKQTAEKVLDYWFTIEFLGQDSYEAVTEAKTIKKNFELFKKLSPDKKNSRKQISIFQDLEEQSDIYSTIISHAPDCNMATWGNLTFFIGKVKRQDCIEKLADILKVNLQQAEKSGDEIPVLSFQCDSKGKYIKNSISLSTIVWSLAQLSHKPDQEISRVLSKSLYDDTLTSIEKTFFESESENESVTEADHISENAKTMEKKEETPVFENDSISCLLLQRVYHYLAKEYSGYLGQNKIVNSCALKFQLFKDSKVKERKDDDNYLGLSHDFFSTDLKMVKDALTASRYNFNKGMLGDLVSYICAPADEDTFSSSCKRRYDFIHPVSHEEFTDEISQIMNIRNAPLGKWPSRFMPAFMQQAAVNLATSDETSGLFGDNGQIFSVNGPPGTGKTTLLKEVIANNIVEKARILSQYQDPDHAFTNMSFKYGDKADHAYTKFFKNWYKFNDDRILNYGILVTSSNNAAVENISKELPLSKGIQKSLKPIVKGEKPDSSEMQKQLAEISSLFSTEVIGSDASQEKTGNATGESHREVYFTKYARKLFGSGEKEADAWGLVAAPLGKKSNISNFYFNALQCILNNEMKRSSDISNNKPQYIESRKEFLAQLNKTILLRDQLGKYGDAVADSIHASQNFQDVKKRVQHTELQDNQEIAALDSQITDARESLTKAQDLLKQKKFEYESIQAELSQKKKQIADYEQQEENHRLEVAQWSNSTGFFTKIFNRKKYNNAVVMAEAASQKADKCKEDRRRIESLLPSIENQADTIGRSRDDTGAQLRSIWGSIETLKNKKERLTKEISDLNQNLEKIKTDLDQKNKERDLLISHFRDADELHTGCVLDEEFVSRLLSDNNDISTSAHVSDPWATQEYNREREKLFYDALQMTKDFVCASKACKANLSILAEYWGLQCESDVNSERMNFHPEDSAAMFGSLLNTLFLVTPVVSSTFASVGRLLKDIKQPGVIGTLIIDEAGQAQPQMAVGALFRARKAIIVGDPKQVEPVVTDDLKMLKDAYSDPVLRNYKDKSLSVQRCADIINPFGTYFDTGTDYNEWVGCPLVVHRRCISPMYEISNSISYSGIMKQQTSAPSESEKKSFALGRSQWINCSGIEKGHGDHYVKSQGEIVCELVERAFEKQKNPDLFIISPFTSVVKGISAELRNFSDKNPRSAIGKTSILGDWILSNIGTVHKFQGKEANEVIFVLGCDKTQKNRYSVTGFVNSNIVNVAATRGKYRLSIVGDLDVWTHNQYVKEAKAIIDTLPIEKISDLEKSKEYEGKNQELADQVSQLPESSSFTSIDEDCLDENDRCQIYTDDFVSALNEKNFLDKDLSEDQYHHFGFTSKNEFNSLPAEVKSNLLMGMKLYYLLTPVFSSSKDLDASCCAILFCKAMELYLRENFEKGLKTIIPEYRIKGPANKEIAIRDAKDKNFMLGTIQYILQNNTEKLGSFFEKKGNDDLQKEWWASFADKLSAFTQERNTCCHPRLFSWDSMNELIKNEFYKDDKDSKRNPKIGGLFFESENGKKLIS